MAEWVEQRTGRLLRPIFSALAVLALLVLAFHGGVDDVDTVDTVEEFAAARAIGEPNETQSPAGRLLVTPGDGEASRADATQSTSDTAPEGLARRAEGPAADQTDDETERTAIAAPASRAEPTAVNDQLTPTADEVVEQRSVAAAPSAPSAAAPATTSAPAAAAPATTSAPAAAAPATTSAPAAAAPATTSAPAAAAPSAVGRTLLSADVNRMTSLGFGQSQTAVENSLEQQFPNLIYQSAANWDDISIVDHSGGAYIRTRSNVGDNSRKQFNAPIEVTPEQYLVYSFLLEPGFDAGDGNHSEGSPVWGTGIKMPGLMRGNPGDNTGGNHSAGGFSGRLMIRGTRKSDGQNSGSREGLSLAGYIYGQEIGGTNIASGFGEDYFLLDGFGSRPFEGINSGLHEGVGDQRIWDLPVGKWVTVVIGYRVDSDDGWLKVWTRTQGEESAAAPRLFVPDVDWMGPGGQQGADSLLFQQFWGGKGSVWHPDSVSYMRFKDFAVFTSEADALAAAR